MVTEKCKNSELTASQKIAIVTGINLGRELQEAHPEIADMYRSGMTQPEIAEELELSTKYDTSENIVLGAICRALRGYTSGAFAEHYNGLISIPEANELAKIHQIENGKRVGRRLTEEGRGVANLSYEKKSEIGKRNYEARVGIHAFTLEERSEIGRKSGLQHLEKGTGIFSMTDEEKSGAGKNGGTISGNNHYKNKTGIFGMTDEEKSKVGKKGYAASLGKQTFEERSERAKELLNKINPDTGEKYAVEFGRARGQRSLELGLGIFARSDEQKSLDGRLGSLAVHANQGHNLWYDEYENPSELLEDLIGLLENPDNQHNSGSHKGKTNWKLVYDQMSEIYPDREFKIPTLRSTISKYEKRIKS